MASSSSPSSSSTQKWKYDVFLSFRGEDTRNNFTDHLYAAFSRKSIVTFRDEEGLERRKPISKLLKAIEVSQFAIIIFSKNYASSTWCLDELAKIVKCREETGLIILPVFYDVDPTDVRKQTATFKQAFIDHQKCFEDNIEKVETWRAALREVADISGWHLQNRHEFEFIQCIVKEMMEKLSSKSSSITKNFVGMESTVEEMIHLYLGFENNVYMIGIYGMGGLGKTTLARVVYDKFCGHFEGSSFIANIREDSKKHGLPRLQKQLLADILGDKKNIDICNVYEGVDMIKKSLCHKKVLLVIDDVNQLDQLEKLVGEKNWFGLGSWIIITTRDEHVLVQHGVLERYKPKVLYNDDASKLFCLKAFKMEQPKEGYEQLSQKVVEYANGLPLALVTLGSFLVGRTIDEWQSALNSFKKTKGEIFDILKISYDGLEEMWKEVFLDIACFFRGRNKDQVIEILENCGFDARIGISVLMEKSLLTMDDGECLWMHDLLQEMGEKIIRLKSDGNLGKQSRLWLNEDLIYVLENDMATEAIQAIVVKGRKEGFNLEEISEGFSKMSNLRLLEIDAMNSLNDQRHLALPNNLRYLWWKCCPFKCLASSHKRMAFVQLDLQHSKFEYLWEGVMRLVNLKFINLYGSRNLIRTPDFSGVPILEGLNISNCSRLIKIHPSIGQLSKLRYLLLENCESLTDLPCMSSVMQSLMVLNLAYSKISSFPKFTGIMKSLLELNLCATAIKEIAPSSIECVPALTLLDLSYCRNLDCIPSNMDNLRSLETLDLSYSNLIRTPDFSGVPILERLNFYCCNSLVEIDPSIWQHSRLRYLRLEYCTSLTDLPCLSAEMQSLTILDLSCCFKISSFPKFSGIMKSLSRLNLAWTAIKKVEPSSIECLTALTFLDLRYCTNLECLPSNMDNLRSLETLDLSKCLKLKSLPRLPSTIRFMDAKGCSSLKWSPKRVKLSIWSQPFSQWLPYDESDNRVGFTILFHFLQGLLCRKAVLDGSIIPSCLAEIEGNSISIELPSNWYNSKWIGFALWASLPLGGYHVMALGDMPQNHCASKLLNIRIYVDVNNELDDSICLLYLSRDDWFAKVGNGECSQIKVIFETDESTKGIRGKCGVSLIYKQDVDEFNETNAQCLIKSFGEVSIYKLIASDDDDDVHIVDDDDDDVYIVGDDDDDNVLIVGDDDFDDDDI